MDKKTQKSIILIYIITFIISLFGATYAYFTVVRVNSISPETEVRSATSEVISFSIANDLNIVASLENFKEGMDSLVTETSASAYMKFDGGTRVVKHIYNLKLVIDDNDFVYTTEEKNAELLLKVTDPSGKQVTSIDGLEYISSKEGFDITTKDGSFYIAKEYPLETSSEIKHDWKVSIIFVNLDVEQNDNYDKILNAHLVMERSDNDAR